MEEREINKLGFAGKIAYTFVMNRRLSLLLILTLFAWGIFSFFITPKQYNPEIVAPAFQVITEFPGASSEEVQELVTKPLENKIADIRGVDDVMSQSMEGGLSILTVKFFVGESIEDSKIKLSQKILGGLDERPKGASLPLIKEINPDDVPIMTIALSSGELSPIALRKLALDIKDEIRLVPNATNIQVVGGRRYQLRVLLDSGSLLSKNISVLQIVDALEKNNIKYLAGDLEIESRKVAVEVDGYIYTAEQLGGLIVQKRGSEVLYFRDVAEVVSGEEEAQSFVGYRKNGEDEKGVVFISVAKMNGKNISPLTRGVVEKINDLKASLIPEMVKVEIVRNDGDTASESVSGLMANLIQAIIIVSLVLMVFLGSRASFIVAIAIPLTLASVFGIGFLAGQTINRITLFALILSLGLLVDNATVIVENAVRHIKKSAQNGEVNKQTAVVRAVDEVGRGLFMSTITTLLAFYPMAFVTGMMGPYMGPIPFFVPAALVVSLIIAFTINPFLSSVLLGEKKKSSEKKNSKIAHFTEVIKIKVDELMNVYRRLLEKILRNEKLRKKIIASTFLIFVIVMMLPVFGIVKFRMLPKADKEQFYIYLDFPVGTVVEESNRISTMAEDFILQNKEVVSIQSFIGEAPILDFNGLFKGAEARKESNQVTIKVNLTHHDNRKYTSEEIVRGLRPELYRLLENEIGTKIKLVEDPPGPPVLSTVLLKIKGRDYEKLSAISYDIEAMLYGTKEVLDIDTSRGEEKRKLSLRIDYDRAQRSGIDAQRVARALNISLSGMKASVLHNDNNKEQEYIFIRLKKEQRNQIEDLQSVYISNDLGEKVPLLELLDVSWVKAEDVIYQDNREQTVYVYAEMGDRSVTYAVFDMYKKLWKYQLDDNNGIRDKVSFFGVNFIDKNSGEEYKIEWGGEWKLTVEVFRDLGTAMILAIFLIYVALVAQFHSFKVPVIIMITIPLAMIGVMPGFALMGVLKGLYFNATSMIGVIALAGIVVNNAIILTEYINDLRKRGYNAIDALVESGATRLRPIVLTSLTTILGSLTIVGDPVWAGLAWSIIFGISVSTVLTLVIFPALYYNFKGRYWERDHDIVRQNWSEIKK